jgi:pre-rRNA-processing protein TSR2
MFASATIELLKENPDADLEWIEEYLLQVMLDEFEVNVDDESAAEVAEQILELRKDCGRGEFGKVVRLKERWESRRGADVGRLFEKRERDERDDETSEEDDEDEDEDGDVDMDMDEAPPLVRVREPIAPEVDEEGFTKVTKKKR